MGIRQKLQERAERRRQRRGARRLIPNATWRAELLSEATRLEGECARAAAAIDQTRGVTATTTRENAWLPGELENYRLASGGIDLARRAAAWPGYVRMLWRWGSGSDLETGWRSLHTADQALLEIQDPATVLARVPDLKAAVKANFSPEDRRVDESIDFLNSCSLQNVDAGRERIRAIKQAADASSDAAHSSLRNYRNWLLITGVVLLLGLVIVAVVHGFHSNFFKICQASKPRKGSCISVDIAEIEAAGALGGLVAAVFALRRLDAYGGPYALPLWQALLRVPSGAAGAVLGIFVMQAGILTSLKAQPDNKLIPYALFFGYAPDFMLRLLDQKANSVGDSARTKNDPLRKAQPSS
jgi:hypothetical protein